jgi:two-component system response regulator MprA
VTTAGICEDDPELRVVLTRALERDGHGVVATTTGTDAVHTFARQPPDVLILDIGLPDADGRDVCAALRAGGLSVPVLFLTARDALPDRISGFNAGGDDYLVKPFAVAELLVRIHALLRRTPEVRNRDGMVLDPAAHAIVNGEHRVALTPTEFRLLSALAARRRVVGRRPRFIAGGWPDGAIVHDNTLDTYVARLRRKLRLAHSPATIKTARGVGYELT